MNTYTEQTDIIEVVKGSKTPKYQQIINSITKAIERKNITRGSNLPSIRQVCQEFSVSRDTVNKAYKDLKSRGIIGATPRKGCFVASESIGHVVRVFLMFDTFRSVKEYLYKAFKGALGQKAIINVFFHHYNLDVFESMIMDNLDNYGFYVIVPVAHKDTHKVLQKIDPEKLLILDMDADLNINCSYVTQNFDEAVFQCFESGLSLIRKYQKINLVYSQDNVHPDKTSDAFKRFCQKYSLENSIIFTDSLKSEQIRKNEAYIVINDDHLIEIIKNCEARQFKLGQDIGVISYNDKPFKEVLKNGITVISTDFRQMGAIAAEHILTSEKIARKICPTSLIVRKSL